MTFEKSVETRGHEDLSKISWQYTHDLLGSVLEFAAILDLVLVFWTKMLFSFSQILVISLCDSFSPVLVDENSVFVKNKKTKEEV